MSVLDAGRENDVLLLADEAEVLAGINRERVAAYRLIAESTDVCDRDRELADILCEFRACRARFWASEAARLDDEERQTVERLKAAGELEPGLYLVDDEPLAPARAAVYGLACSLVFWALLGFLVYVLVAS